VWIKICGITRREDGLFAAEQGADALGFVLTRSPRRADPGKISAWIHELEDVEKVGVFVDEDPSDIIRLSEMLGLDAVQLHTKFDSRHMKILERFNIIYSVRNLRNNAIPADIPCRILVDPSRGSGTRAPWEKAEIPFILAGGLTPDNVKDAICRAEPTGVDVSSGVESAPGIKDPDLVRRFIQEARS